MTFVRMSSELVTGSRDYDAANNFDQRFRRRTVCRMKITLSLHEATRPAVSQRLSVCVRLPLATYPVSRFEMTDTNGDTIEKPMVACARIFHRLYGFLRCGRHKMAEQKKAHIYRPHRLTSHSPSQSSELLFASHFTTHDDPISN